jgi:hypothetical protein
MVKVQDAHKLYESHNAKSESWIETETKATDAKLREIADVFSRSSGRELVRYDKPETVLIYKLAKTIQKEPVSWVLTHQDFTVPDGRPRQIAMEVFYDPQFYNLELLVESRDAGEQEEGRASRWSHKSKVEITNYKGSKRILAELEPGDYTLIIIAKLPGSQS